MIWVNRAGVKSVYLPSFLKTSKIYLPWEGYKKDLSEYATANDYKELVISEKGDLNRTSLANWAGQLFSFVREMNIGDLVLIPHTSSRYYTLAQIEGEYLFSTESENGLWHSRDVKILIDMIPRDAFSQSLQYSLGAYRTIFKVKKEDECLKVFERFM